MQSGFTKNFLFQGESVGGRYDSEEILTHRAVQAWTVIRGQKSGGDRTLHTGVMTTSCPLARDDPSPAPQCLHSLRKCHISDHGPMT